MNPTNPDHDSSPHDHTLAAMPLRAAEEQRLILLLESDPQVIEMLSLQLGYFGYRICPLDHPDDLGDMVLSSPPVALIVDLASRRAADVADIRAACQASGLDLPVVILSERGDLADRLEAVRAGGTAYLLKPVNVDHLIDTLDSFTTVQVAEPFRILVIDDSPLLARFHAEVLENAGMLTRKVTDPMQVTQPLSDFHPDLILMDMYMPGCTGVELAAVLRQQAAFVGIPIVFLSGETDLEKHLVAMGTGGDDFLTKPIEPRHLVSTVTSRVQRARTIRSLMTRDSLTGLLNHAVTKERLAVEVARAEREGQPLAFAILDLDRFKQVNDTYGHMAGDRVLKALARLLVQRLRRIDVIGRYGGEEFAVALPGVDGIVAARLIDEIRADFGRLPHQVDGYEFVVTFSAGVAGYPRYPDAYQLTRAADWALYGAKRAGRNQAVLADL